MSSGKIRVERISTREAFEEFARLPFQVYADREAWWPPDVQNEVDLLSGQSLITRHLDLEPICAYREGQMVARVSAVVNHRYNEHWNEKLGQLIHFEALPDQDEAVSALLQNAVEWLGEHRMKAVRSGFAAFLDYPYAIDGYGDLPSFLLRGNPDCYHRYFKNAGFFTEKGEVDYTARLTPEIMSRYTQMIEVARASRVVVRSWREYGFLGAIDAWTEITNSAFERHWGWNPISREEVRPMLSPLSGTMVTDLSMLATIGSELVGAVFSVPDLSAALARVKPGVRLKPERGGGTRGALINIGVIKSARGRGVAAAMAARSFITMARYGMRYAGYTLVMDDNWPSRRTAERLGARVTGNFVTYRRDL